MLWKKKVSKIVRNIDTLQPVNLQINEMGKMTNVSAPPVMYTHCVLGTGQDSLFGLFHFYTAKL